MRHRFGLMGLAADGTLYAPSGSRLVRLPFGLASRVQRVWNTLAFW